MIKLREYLRAESRSTTGVVNRRILVGDHRLVIQITKSGWVTVEYQNGRMYYYVRLVDDRIDYLQYKYVKRDNSFYANPTQDALVEALKQGFKICYPLYNVKAKTTSSASIAKRLIPCGYSASINTTGPKINGIPANMY